MSLIDLGKNDIKIKQVLMGAGDEPKFVEFFSKVDSRNHIINAERFCEIFGYKLDELKDMR